MRRSRAILLLLLALPLWGFEWPGRVERLSRELKHADAARRQEVLRLLTQYPAQRVREPLMRALADPEPGVRLEAAVAAGRVGLREASSVLIEWLGDKDATTRMAAARALGQLEEPRALQALVRLLGDNEVQVRLTAIRALVALAAPESVPALIGRLDDTADRVRAATADVLGRIGDTRAVVPLVAKARDDVPEVRAAVYRALGALGDARAAFALLQGFEDSDESARLAAISAVGRIDPPEAVDELERMLDHPDPRTTKAALAALGNLRGSRAARLVVAQLARTELRAQALQILAARAEHPPRPGRRDDEASDTASGAPIAALVQALETALDPDHVGAIAEALIAIAAHADTAAAAPNLVRALNDERGPAGPLLMALAMTAAPEARMPLVERIERAPAEQADDVLEAVERYFERTGPDGRAADPLLAVLGKAPPAQRPRIVRLLGRSGAARVVPELQRLLSHPDPALRIAAVTALGLVGDEASAQALLPMLAARGAQIRYAAARALGQAAVVETVTQLLARLTPASDADPHATLLALGPALRRFEREAALSEATAAQAMRTLERLARGGDEGIAARAVDALRLWGRPEAARLVGTLVMQPDPERRIEAIVALGSFAQEQAVDGLRFVLQRGSLREVTAAAGALGEHGSARDVSQLVGVVERQAWPATAAAAFALARLARRGHLDARDWQDRLCTLVQRRRDPYVRANLIVALGATGAPGCLAETPLERWLGRRHTSPVQAAAALWLRTPGRDAPTVADAQPAEDREAEGRERPDDDAIVAHGEGKPAPSAASDTETLSACAARALDEPVVQACQRTGAPKLNAEVDVHAYGPDGTRLITQALVALRLPDGSVLVVPTDANGHVRLGQAPSGRVWLEDPHEIALEPPGR